MRSDFSWNITHNQRGSFFYWNPPRWSLNTILNYALLYLVCYCTLDTMLYITVYYCTLDTMLYTTVHHCTFDTMVYTILYIIITEIGTCFTPAGGDIRARALPAEDRGAAHSARWGKRGWGILWFFSPFDFHNLVFVLKNTLKHDFS